MKSTHHIHLQPTEIVSAPPMRGPRQGEALWTKRLVFCARDEHDKSAVVRDEGGLSMAEAQESGNAQEDSAEDKHLVATLIDRP